LTKDDRSYTFVFVMGRENNKIPRSDLLTKIEAQEYLRMSRSTLDWLIQEGKLPILKLRRKIFIRIRDIEKFLDDNIQSCVGSSSPGKKKEPEDT